MGRLLNDVWDNESTYQEALCYAVTKTKGPVVELGGGYYSTPMLHGLCQATERELWTIESEYKWSDLLMHWETPWHHVIFDPECKLPDTKPAVVLVDHDTGDYLPGNGRVYKRAGVTRGDRVREARLMGVRYVVAHDTQPDWPDPAEFMYPGLAEAIDEFKYVKTYMLPEPGAWTSLCSDEPI